MVSIYTTRSDRQTINYRVFALGNGEHQHHQNIVINLIGQPITLLEQLDLVAIPQGTV